jgi:hypothetical protein
MRFWLFSFLTVLFLTPVYVTAWQDQIPSQPKSDGRVCVAVVSNASTMSAFVERMTARLTKSLKENKINALMMDSRTTTGRQLQPTVENGNEARDKECDYVLLTQIVDPRAHPFDPQGAEISIGGRVPSVDASDPLSGSSGPVYRDNLQIGFAMFRIGRFKPVLDTLLKDRPSGNVSDSLVLAMDRVANRVSHELRKK